jgi:hypothetical protein
MNCEKMLKKNLKDLRKGRPMRFTKYGYTNAEDFNAFEARWWNIRLPNAEQYTKEEHTKEEHTNAKGFNALEAGCWNLYLPNAEQYTEEEIKYLQELIK